MTNKLIFLITITFISSISFADESNSTYFYNFYQTNRAMAMGNAFSPVSDDATAIFYNPAALAFRDKGEIQFNLAQGNLNKNTEEFVKGIKDIQDSNLSDNDKNTALAEHIEKYYGDALGLRTKLLEFMWARKNWGIALIPAQVSVQAIPHKQVGPVVDLNAYKDTSLTYAHAGLLTDTLSVGGALHVVHRNHLSGLYTSLDLALDEDTFDVKNTKEGLGVNLDIALMWKPFRHLVLKPNKKIKKPSKPVDEFVPDEDGSEDPNAEVKTDLSQVKVYENSIPLTLSFVTRNALSTGYKKMKMVNKDALEAPDKDPAVIDIGAGYSVFDNSVNRLDVTMEFKNLLHEDSSFQRNSHAGLEYSIYRSWVKLALRAGVNQSYFTAGIGLQLTALSIDVATYGEEMGTQNHKIENRVTAATLGFVF